MNKIIAIILTLIISITTLDANTINIIAKEVENKSQVNSEKVSEKK